MSTNSTSDLESSLQAAIKEVLVAHLRKPGISISSYQEKRTGNSYQSVRFGDEQLRGFRVGDRHVFAGVDLEGRTVLDLGCNLGEISRDAARAGASRVLGIEYDSFFVQMARYIAAHNKLPNVSYIQGDLTDAATYQGEYDVVVALSVYTYIKDHIERICAQTKELLIIETHAVKENWKSLYHAKLSRHFKHVAVVGLSDHKAADRSESRYLLFASSKPLNGVLSARARALAGAADLPTLNLKRSRITHFDSCLDTLGLSKGMAFPALLAGAMKGYAAIPFDAIIQEVAERGLVQSPLYWRTFLAGFKEYSDVGGLETANVYYRLIKELIDRNLYDGAFKTLMTRRDQGIRRLALRFEMIARLLDGQGGFAAFDPVIAFNLVPGQALSDKPQAYSLYVNDAGDSFAAMALDGHHRMFLAYILGATNLPFVPMWYEGLPAVEAFKRRHEVDVWDHVYAYSQGLGRILAGAAE